jgi:hypothetical protein
LIAEKINCNNSFPIIAIVNVLLLGAIIANNSKTFCKQTVAIIANNCK